MNETSLNVARWLVGAWLLVLAPLTLAQAEPPRERYYIVELSGQRAGWMRELQRTTEEAITSEVEMHFEIKRGETGVAITMQSTFVETPDHKPLSMSSTQSMAANPITTEVTFGADELTVDVTQSGSTSTQQQPLPEGEWLTPAAAEEYVRRRLEAGADKIVVRSLDPLSGTRPVITTYEGFSEETISVLGREVQAIRAKLTTSESAGLTTIEHMDHTGRMLRSTTNLGGIEMSIIAADRELAMTELDAPELMQSTLVEPIGKIENPREVERASYILRVPDGELGDLPELAAQRVTRLDDRSLRVEVTMGEGENAKAEEAPGEEHLASSSMIDKDDEAVVKLAKRAAPREEAPPSVVAEAMRRFVYDHIDEKHLGVGMGSASEVARTGTGDCTEHATLLAAMLRAEGIPSRTVSGLVYVSDFEGSQDIFGYHMWTQAWVELDGTPRWVDFDATLGPAGRFDATHIALSVSAMADGQSNNALISLVPLLGRLEIEVESTE